MKKQLNSVLTLSVFLAIVLACSFTTANLSDMSFAEDKDGDRKIETASRGDMIFAVTSLNNTSSKHKIRWEILDPSGDEVKLGENEVEVDGAAKLWYGFPVRRNAPLGKYKFTVILLDEDGKKEIDKKTGTLNVKGDKSNDDSGSDDDDSASEDAGDY